VTGVDVRRVLTWVLAVTLVASVGAVGFIAVNPPETTDPYSEFYVLGPGGNATGYPTNLTPGETGTVIVGVSNHEHERVEYRVEVSWDNETTQSYAVGVPDDETRERRVEVTAPEESGRYAVRFELYKGDPEGEPYRWLRLWVEVSERFE
jgi:uncharacterized membrane protein